MHRMYERQLVRESTENGTQSYICALTEINLIVQIMRKRIRNDLYDFAATGLLALTVSVLFSMLHVVVVHKGSASTTNGCIKEKLFCCILFS